MNQSDHDLLLEIKGDVKHILDWTSSHDKKDDMRFEKVEKDLGFHRKIIYGCIGIVAFIEFITKLFK